jgi:hypothetical protein
LSFCGALLPCMETLRFDCQDTFVIALTEKFGGDSVAELQRAMRAWTTTVREQFASKPG